MPPLILHNVPDEELYVGEDGIQRPYAMLFPGADATSTRSRKTGTLETGSFGKSTRRSRSRTGTPAAKREDPTLAAADKIFSDYIAQKAATISEKPNRKGLIPSSTSQTSHLRDGTDANEGKPTERYVHREPTEVVLRGFKMNQQYAAIREFERIGGRICEDYSRDPPIEQRKYKSDIRDPATLRRKPLTAEEKAKAVHFAGGEHWIKVTFDSAEAAERAVEASPQTILGHRVFAELYRGVPPSDLAAIPSFDVRTPNKGSVRSSTLPRSYTVPDYSRGGSSFSPDSHTSSQTLDTGTLTASSATITGPPQSLQDNNPSDPALLFCRKIPSAKRIQLLPAEQALLPQKSRWQQWTSSIPLLNWVTGDIIGTQVPTVEDGSLDWAKASFYWRFIYWLDGLTGWFDVVGGEKED